MTIIVPLQPNLGIPPTDLQSDSATPRGVLSSTLVAAVASLPTLSPVFPTYPHDPDYRLTAKRKQADSDEDDDEDLPRPTKKAKGDADALFGPLAPSPQPSKYPLIQCSQPVFSPALFLST